MGTKKGFLLQSTESLGVSNPALGGIISFETANTALIIPAIPAAALRCPIWLFIDPTATCSPLGDSLKISVKVPSSVASPTLVDVPCASINPTDSMEYPA